MDLLLEPLIPPNDSQIIYYLPPFFLRLYAFFDLWELFDLTDLRDSLVLFLEAIPTIQIHSHHQEYKAKNWFAEILSRAYTHDSPWTSNTCAFSIRDLFVRADYVI